MFNRLKKTLFVANAPGVSTPAAPVSASTNDPQLESASLQNRGDAFLGQNQLAEAAECYRQAAQLNPGNGGAHCGLGIVYIQQGSYENAAHHLQQAVTASPALPQAHYFLGNAWLKLGNLGAAVESFNAALRLAPDAEIVYGDLCFALFMSGRAAEARDVIIRGLALNPNNADFHFLLGNLYSDEQDVPRALACYQKTLSLQPAHLGAWMTSGKLLQAQGKEDEAIQCFTRALAIEPSLFDAYSQLGHLYASQARPDEAAASFQQALALSPDSFEIYHNLGLLAKGRGKFDEAIEYYNKSLALMPDFADTHCNLGNVYFEQGRLDEAEACFRTSLRLKPDSALACYGLSITLAARKNRSETVATLRRLLELEPVHASARSMLFHELQHMCDWGDWAANVQAARQAALLPQQALNELAPFTFMCLPGATAAEQKRCAEQYAKTKFGKFAALRNRLGFDFKRSGNERVRIGYLSADFRTHPVAFLMAEIFELHDRSRFHISAYSTSPGDGSPMRSRLERAFDNFVDIQQESYESAAKRIHADRIDVLVDLSGYTQNARSEILALRPAPVQVNYLGYPGTMGADFIDYIIADRYTIPAERQQHYTEKVCWMPDCYQANDRTRARPAAPTRAQCGLPDQAVVFCCFNQSFKITPEFFDVWCRLLKAVPGSVLWLAASTPQVEANLRREAVGRGVEAGRIIMAPLARLEDHLARLQCADLFLDTLPFNAGTTCSDALWMGLPVVTCAGDAFASRMAGSLLTAIGAPELITDNLDDYYRVALELAADTEKRQSVRARIDANRGISALFDSARFTRNLEQAYLHMLEECAGKFAGS